MYQIANDRETLKQLEDKLKKRTPTKRPRIASLDLKESYLQEERGVEKPYRPITLEDEMSNLDMIKERLRLLSAKNKTIKPQSKEHPATDTTILKEKDYDASGEFTPKRNLIYQALQTENIIQREEIAYLKRVNDIQNQQIERLRSMLRKGQPTRLFSGSPEQARDSLQNRQLAKQRVQYAHSKSFNDHIASSIKDLKSALAGALSRTKQRASQKKKPSNLSLLQSMKKSRG